jgi:hypothetical protein
MDEEFEVWRPALTWVIVCGFGRAFLCSLLSRVVGVNPVRQSVPCQVQGMPGSEGLMNTVAGRFGELSVQGLIDRMIEGLARA